MPIDYSGQTDSSAALQALLDAPDGSAITLLSGTILLLSDVHFTRKTLLSGAGRDQTVFNTRTGARIIVERAATYSHLENFSINGQPLPSTVWQASTQYDAGARVFFPNETRFVLEASTGGTSGTSVPVNPTQDGVSVSDGDITWTCVSRAGVIFKGQATIERVNIFNTTNLGLHIEGVAPSNSNCWSASNMMINGCGAGLSPIGGDSNRGVGTRIDVQNIGISVPDDVKPFAHGIWDHSFLGCVWIACQADNTKGRAFLGDGTAARSVWVGCHVEGSCQSAKIVYPSLVLGGLYGGPDGSNDIEATNVTGDAQSTQAIAGLDNILGHGTSFAMLPRDGYSAFTFGSKDDITSQWRMLYGWGNSQYGVGWYDLSYGFQSFRSGIALSGAAAPEGAGTIGFPHTIFMGPKKLALGPIEEINDKQVRGGKRFVGDCFGDLGAGVRFVGPLGNGQRGATAGWAGKPWAANMSVVAAYPPEGVQADVVVAPDGNAYQCIVLGTTGQQEPAWDPSGQPFTDGTATWKFVGPIAQSQPYGT